MSCSQWGFFSVVILTVFLSPLTYSQSDSPFYTSALTPLYEDVFSFDYEKVTHVVQMGLDVDGLPLHYYANLITPVCDDSICEILHLEMYWDLLGNYIGFDTIPGFALTKYDHEKFTDDEYVSLHKILLDNSSDLGELEMMDLISNVENYDSGVIDAISGATNVDIANSVVKGGVYSCYILWHIANPLTKVKILEHTAALLDVALVTQMLTSTNSVYQMYILSGFGSEDYQKNQKDILLALSQASPKVLAYLIDNMPDAFLGLDEAQTLLTRNFSCYSVLPRYKLLQRFASCQCITSSGVEVLSLQLESMSFMQLQQFVDILINRPALVSEKMVNHITQVVSQNTYPYNFVLEEYLMRIK